MKYFYSNNSKGFYVEEFFPDYVAAGTLPDDLVELTESDYRKAQEILNAGHPIHVSPHGVRKGNLQVNPKDAEEDERGWRNMELARADIELFKVQDSDPKAVGSVADWRQYRKELRAWPEHEGFPSKANRPKAPDAV